MTAGTKEWAERNVNIQVGCEHGCRYCYARYNAVVRFKRCTDEQWRHPVIDQSKVEHGRKKYKGIVMFPSSHDITPVNLKECISVIDKLLVAGNQVLIVSKPHWDCIVDICTRHKGFNRQITFRFTIGSLSDDVLKFWEPGATPIHERLVCLAHARKHGFKTSVSCEPYLDMMYKQHTKSVKNILPTVFG